MYYLAYRANILLLIMLSLLWLGLVILHIY